MSAVLSLVSVIRTLSVISEGATVIAHVHFVRESTPTMADQYDQVDPGASVKGLDF